MKEKSGGATDYETSPDATLIVSASGMIRRANDAALAMFGYSRDELVGCALDCLMPERLRDRHRAHVEHYFRRPYARYVALPTQLRALCKDGRELDVDISLGPIETHDGTCAVAVLRPHASTGVERTLRKRLDFEALVTDITADVVVATPESIDGALLNALERLRSAVSADRAVFLEYTEDWTAATLTHVAYASGIPKIPEKIDVRNLFPWADGHLRAGKTVCIPDVSDLPEEAAIDQANWKALAAAAILIVPVFPADGFRHAIIVDRSSDPCAWPIDLGARMRLLGEIMVDALMRNRHITQLARAHEELKAIKVRLESENLYLRETLVPRGNLNGIVAASPGMAHVMELVTRVAPTESTVLLLGETGTGKELLARAIHRLSRRKDRLLIAVNCAALPASLVESELFGREKGAYTGALARQAGRFEVADGSTLFLDEVGELPLDLQAKLLRVIESGEFERLGSSRTQKVNVRIIAATNRDLAAAVGAATFRKDLYFRLSVFPIAIPPLRERQEEIPALVWSIAREIGERMGRPVETIPVAVMERLQRHSWEGNVRELRNLVERALILSTGPSLVIELPHEAVPSTTSTPEPLTLDEAERSHILRTLEATRGRIRGNGGAAEQLGVHEATLRSRMKKLGITRPSA